MGNHNALSIHFGCPIKTEIKQNLGMRVINISTAKRKLMYPQSMCALAMTCLNILTAQDRFD